MNRNDVAILEIPGARTTLNVVGGHIELLEPCLENPLPLGSRTAVKGEVKLSLWQSRRFKIAASVLKPYPFRRLVAAIEVGETTLYASPFAFHLHSYSPEYDPSDPDLATFKRAPFLEVVACLKVGYDDVYQLLIELPSGAAENLRGFFEALDFSKMAEDAEDSYIRGKEGIAAYV